MGKNQFDHSAAQASKRHFTVGKNAAIITANNAITMGGNFVADKVLQHAPANAASWVMEGADLVIAAPVAVAERFDRNGKPIGALALRTLANSLHMGAAGYGFKEGYDFWLDPKSIEQGNLAISFTTALLGVSIAVWMRRNREAHNDNRNMQNIRAFAYTNAAESLAGIASWPMQAVWERGSAASVMLSSAMVGSIIGWQMKSDFNHLQEVRDSTIVDIDTKNEIVSHFTPSAPEEV
jgi:hypothetical protein